MGFLSSLFGTKRSSTPTSTVVQSTKLPEEILSQWENIGLDIAQLSSRSWEPALSYFAASAKVQQYLPSGQFLGWCK